MNGRRFSYSEHWRPLLGQQWDWSVVWTTFYLVARLARSCLLLTCVMLSVSDGVVIPNIL